MKIIFDSADEKERFAHVLASANYCSCPFYFGLKEIDDCINSSCTACWEHAFDVMEREVNENESNVD